MMDSEPRFTASRAQRVSVGLTVLAVALLTCGAAVETTGNVLHSPASGSGGGPRPTTTARPTRTRSRVAVVPSPCCPQPTPSVYLPDPRPRPLLPVGP